MTTYKFEIETQMPEEVMIALESASDAFVIKEGVNFRVFVVDKRDISFWGRMFRRRNA